MNEQNFLSIIGATARAPQPPSAEIPVPVPQERPPRAFLVRAASPPLRVDLATARFLLKTLGPSLGLWRAAEVSVLRSCRYSSPVLDLGCGDGLVTSMVLPEVDIGVDPDSAALEKARERQVYSMLLDLPLQYARLPRGSFRTVLSNSVLEHVRSIDEVLLSITRILAPGGRLIFTVPTDVFSSHLVLPLNRYARWRNAGYGHVNLWPLPQWRQRLSRVGLEIESTRTYMRPGLVRCWDWLDLMQQVWIGRRRLFGLFWKRLPEPVWDRMSRSLANIDFSAGERGGGRLIVARKIS